MKIYGTILDSSIWSAEYPTRLVWLSLLAMADKNGQVQASTDGIARRANVSLDECEKAIKTLRSPDRRSKNKLYDGRRIRKIENGWLVLNYKRYRDMRTDSQVAEAEKKQRYRDRKRAGLVGGHGGQSTASTGEGEAKADAEGEKEVPLPRPATPRSNNGGGPDVLEAGEIVQQIKKLAQSTPTGTRFIAREDVEQLGPDVGRAFAALGGAQRFLTTDGKETSILISQFGKALYSARQEAGSGAR